MTYTEEKLILFDKILQYYYEYHALHTESRQPTDTLFSKLLDTDIEEAQYCINEVCKNGDELGLLIAQKFGYGSYTVVKLHKSQTKEFIQQGGFLKHFRNGNINNNRVVEVHIGDNIYDVGQLNKNEIHSSSNFSVRQKYIKNTPDTVNIILTIIGLILTLIGVYIAYLQLKY